MYRTLTVSIGDVEIEHTRPDLTATKTFALVTHMVGEHDFRKENALVTLTSDRASHKVNKISLSKVRLALVVFEFEQPMFSGVVRSKLRCCNDHGSCCCGNYPSI